MMNICLIRVLRILLKPREINFVFMYVKSDLINNFNQWITVDKPQVTCNWLNFESLLLFAKKR